MCTPSFLALRLFGVARVRADVASRACSVFPRALAAAWTVWIAGIVGLLGSAPERTSAVLGTLFAAITLSIGAVIHVGGVPSHRHAPSGSPSIE